MNKNMILAELQALIDKLFLEGYTVNLAKLTVSKRGETFDATLKGAQPSKAAQDEHTARLEADPNRDLPF